MGMNARLGGQVAPRARLGPLPGPRRAQAAPAHLQLEAAVAQEHLCQRRGKLVDGMQELPVG